MFEQKKSCNPYPNDKFISFCLAFGRLNVTEVFQPTLRLAPGVSTIWREQQCPTTGKSYYWNVQTGVTQWNPPDEGYLSLVEQEIEKEMQKTEDNEDQPSTSHGLDNDDQYTPSFAAASSNVPPEPPQPTTTTTTGFVTSFKTDSSMIRPVAEKKRKPDPAAVVGKLKPSVATVDATATTGDTTVANGGAVVTTAVSRDDTSKEAVAPIIEIAPVHEQPYGAWVPAEP